MQQVKDERGGAESSVYCRYRGHVIDNIPVSCKLVDMYIVVNMWTCTCTCVNIRKTEGEWEVRGGVHWRLSPLWESNFLLNLHF